MNKKTNLIIAGTFMLSLTYAQKKPFTIEGKVIGKTDAYVYLYGGAGIDSALVKDGKFKFQGELAGPTESMVFMDKTGDRGFAKTAQIYLEPAQMQLTIDYNNFGDDGIKLTGSNVQKEADLLKESQAPARAQLKPLRAKYDKAVADYSAAMKKTKDEKELEPFKKAMEDAKEAMYPIQAAFRKAEVEFMDKYPTSYVTASLLRYHTPSAPREESLARFEKLPVEIQNSDLGKAVKSELDKIKLGAPGSHAFEFAGTELRGGELKLSDYKGKYVLIDFWASWCVPCRKGNPHLIQLYNKYKDKGFEIIGVSDDDMNEAAWRKAVDQDQIAIWKHILTGKKYGDGTIDNNNSIPAKYGIYSLPTKILVDKNGMIIGRFGGGGDSDADMDKMLAMIFGS